MLKKALAVFLFREPFDGSLCGGDKSKVEGGGGKF